MMGVYYMAINRTKREKLDPDASPGGPKLYPILYAVQPSFAAALVLLMSSAWYSDDVRVITDNDDAWDEASSYRDVSERTLRELCSAIDIPYKVLP